jgi:hypothetical protein
LLREHCFFAFIFLPARDDDAGAKRGRQA